MNTQGAIKFNKTFIIGTILVLFILCVYTLHYSPKTKHSLAEKQHDDWLKQIKQNKNGTVENQNIQQSMVDQSEISMEIQEDIPEDIHRPQTYDLPEGDVTERENATPSNRISMVLPGEQSNTNGPEENVKIDESKTTNEEKGGDGENVQTEKREGQERENVEQEYNNERNYIKTNEDNANTFTDNDEYDNVPTDIKEVNNEYETYKINTDGTEDNDEYSLQTNKIDTEGEEDNDAFKDLQKDKIDVTDIEVNEGTYGTEERIENNNFQIPEIPYPQHNAPTETEQKQTAGTYKGEDASEFVELPRLAQEYIRNNENSYPNAIQLTLGRVDIADSNVPENAKPIVRSDYNRDNDISVYNALNRNTETPLKKYGIENPAMVGSILSDTNRQLLDDTAKNEDSSILLPSYQAQNGDTETNIFKPMVNGNGIVLSEKAGLTQHTQAENGAEMQSALQDMADIANYGSANSDDDNKNGWKWNADEKQTHLYDENDTTNKFGDLVMQVNHNAEPVTGTTPNRPPYASKMQYPSYLTPIDWKSSFEHVKTPIFECVPMRTLYYYIRICIHPPAVKSEVSAQLKAEASWEYYALRDMQIALFEHKDSMLIDIGASIGVFSLAAAALNRRVIAVEPYSSNIQVFKQSVLLNRFTEHITLFQAVVSDRHGKVLVKRLGDKVEDVYIQTVEDDEPSTNYSLVVNSVTLDDIEKVIPTKIAVLKIDVPGFVKKVLENSHYFFRYIYVTHVFMHWDTSDTDLCHFLVRFFVERGYQPYTDLRGKESQLRIEDADIWTNDIVIWKL